MGGGLPYQTRLRQHTNPGVDEIRRISVVNLDTWQERSPTTGAVCFGQQCGGSGELVIDHIANQGGCGFDAQFVQDATFVGADGLGESAHPAWPTRSEE